MHNDPEGRRSTRKAASKGGCQRVWRCHGAWTHLTIQGSHYSAAQRPCPHSKNTTVRALLSGGDIPGNPIDAHLLQMTSPELKLAVSASQGLASRCETTERSFRGQEWKGPSGVSSCLHREPRPVNLLLPHIDRSIKALHRTVADPRRESPRTYHSVWWIDSIEEEADSQEWESLADRPSTGSVIGR
jgi:hypothetical protein